MFGWFTKKTSPPTQPGRSRAPSARTRANSGALPWDTPASLPEVVEGNSDADWSAWQDSVDFQESRTFANSDLKTEPAPLSPHTQETEHVFEHAARRKNS
jgi:hypothetical protein